MSLSIKILKQQLTKPLPGLESHLKMAPKDRVKELHLSTSNQLNARQSAVLALLFPENKRLKLIFIKRSENGGIHSGQISFPGGKYENNDKDFQTTALREAYEEIGVEPKTIEIIGQLSDLYIPPSNFLVKSFVGYCTHKPHYVINRDEVQFVIEIYLDDFFEKSSIFEKEFLSGSTRKAKLAPYYKINNTEIWGATAMIVSELTDILKPLIV